MVGVIDRVVVTSALVLFTTDNGKVAEDTANKGNQGNGQYVTLPRIGPPVTGVM